MPEHAAHPTRRGGVVITGLAATTSLGITAESIWSAVLEGRRGIGPMPDIESPLPSRSSGGQAAPLPDNYHPHLPREARYLCWTVEHALRDANVHTDSQPTRARRCAVLGTTLHGIRAGGRFLRSGNTDELRSFLASATSQIALDGLGIDGGVLTTCSACSSSLGAVALGVTLLECGKADLVVAGGYDVISEYAWAGFNSLRLIADGPLRPFCRDRRGMNIAEGYGIVILERADSALARNATPRARLAGWGESADAHHLTQPHPEGEGALTAMRQAIDRAGINARDLNMIAAHATGTADNDAAEFRALHQLLGEDLPSVPVVGLKSFIGHTLGGAGAIELIISCMALRHQCIPACPDIRPDEIEYPGLALPTGKTAPRTIESTLNTSLGFGGANTCVVLTQPHHTASPRAVGTSPTQAPAAWITGVGVVLPGAIGHAAFVKRMSPSSPPSSASCPTKIGDSEIIAYLNARRTRRLSECVKYTLAAATMAVRDAGLDGAPDRLATASAIVGSMHGSASFCYDYYAQIVAEGVAAANPVLFAEGVPNAPAAHLSITLGLKGSCQTIIGSRTAGLDALALAALRVQSGVTETVIVVAAEGSCAVVDQAYHDSGVQLPSATHNTSDQRPFTGSCGAVAFIVESARAATARGCPPYARVNDSRWAGPLSPDRGGPARAVAFVLAHLDASSRFVGSACNTWIDRAERLGMRRAGIAGEPGSAHARFGQLFAVAPLVEIAAALAHTPPTPPAPAGRLTTLCTDWSGAVSALSVEHFDRRPGTPLTASTP